MTDENSIQRRRSKIETWTVFSILIVVALFTTGDIISDVGEGAGLLHLAAEAIVALISFIGALLLWRRTIRLRVEVSEQKFLVQQADIATQNAIAQADQWRKEAATLIKGLSDAIDSQLSRWQLSNAEKEVALLLLKGLSLKEIADVRGVSEKTARAQSFAVYSKSGLGGRAELSAFFLEDLMVPPSAGPLRF